MSLWTKLVNFVEGVDDEASLKELRDEELQVACAALLINAGSIDGKFDSNEKQKVKALLQRRFDLEPDELKRLFQEASAEEREAVDLYRFTKILTRDLDQDGRKRIVAMLWEVVMADGVIDEFESNLVARVAELIGVSTRDRVTIRKMVEARMQAS